MDPYGTYVRTRMMTVTFAILEKLPAAGQRIPPWKRVWVRGDNLIAQAAALRRTHRKKAMEHKRSANDGALRRTLSQIKAADELRGKLEPQPGSAKYWADGGRPADERWQPYDDRLLKPQGRRWGACHHRRNEVMALRHARIR